MASHREGGYRVYSAYKTQLGNIHAFLDNDEAGRKAIATAAAAGILTQAEYNAAVCSGMQNSELEDFLTEYLYADVIYHSMLKFFVLDDSLREVVAVSSAPAPEGAFASSFLGGPPGQLP
jgi:hypothetical protein